MTKEELRDALNRLDNLEKLTQLRPDDPWNVCRRYSKALLALMESHPNLQELIEGNAWIAPNEPTVEMVFDGAWSIPSDARGKPIGMRALLGEPMPSGDPAPMYRAMRDAFLRQSHKGEV